MTPTNAQIIDTFSNMVAAEGFAYPVKYPGVDFTPPGNGYWLEVDFLPNRGIDNGLSYTSSYVPQGILQITVASRTNSTATAFVADTVQAAFPKGTAIIGSVRVSNHPYQSQPDELDDRVLIGVTFEYIG